MKVRRLKEDVFHFRFDASETVGFAFQGVGCISAASADETGGLPVCGQLWVAPQGLQLRCVTVLDMAACRLVLPG